MRRILLVVLVVALAGLAGCVSDDITGNDDIESDANGENDANQQTDDSESADTDDGGETDSQPAVDGQLQIHHIDVGQGDATLVTEPSGETMLIDSGGWQQDGSEVIATLEAKGIDRIDHLVSTHGHADHIGGHAAVIEHFETEGEGIGTIYDSGVAHTSQTYDNYLDAVEEHDVELIPVREGDQEDFGDATIDFYNPPEGDSGDDLHYNSVTLTVTFGEMSYLTTGDAETDAEERMVTEYGDELEADILHAGHHGSSTSSTAQFLEVVDPDVAVISSAYDSQYGHPHDEVLERFDEFGIETSWTGLHGDVIVRTDGETYDIELEEDGPTDPLSVLEGKPADDQSSISQLATDSISIDYSSIDYPAIDYPAIDYPSIGYSSANSPSSGAPSIDVHQSPLVP